VSLELDLGFNSNLVVCDGRFVGGAVSIQGSCNSYSD